MRHERSGCGQRPTERMSVFGETFEVLSAENRSGVMCNRLNRPVVRGVLSLRRNTSHDRQIFAKFPYIKQFDTRK